MLKFINAVIYGTLGASAVFLAGLFAWPAWILFIGWIGYYQAGACPKAALNILLLMLLGMLLAMLMQLSAGWMEPYWGNYAILPVVFVLIAALSFMEQVKWFSNMTGYFLGMVICFGAGRPLHPANLLHLGLPVAAGLLFGWLSVALMTAAKRNLLNHNPL